MSFLEYRLKLAPTGFSKVFYINWALILVLTAIAAIGWLMLYSIASGQMDVWALPQIKRYGLGMVILLAVALRVFSRSGPTPGTFCKLKASATAPTS